MPSADANADLNTQYYVGLAAAFVRGRLAGAPALPPEELVRHGLAAGLRLHRFKRTMPLPRVRKVLGILRGLHPGDLADIGSGRGTFLWPLLDSFPDLPVTAIERDALRAHNLQAVARGGVARLQVVRTDMTRLGLREGAADVVTALEVLEHVPQPEQALREVMRVARRFAVLSVPSHEDDNPEHVHRFTRASLRALCEAAGARNLRFDQVLNHHICVATVGPRP